MRTFLAACLISLILLPSAAVAADRVVARVGTEAITSRELTAALAQNPELGRQKVLDLLIERRLVLVWAKGRNISVGDEELEKVATSIRERNNLSEEQFERALQSQGESLKMFRSNLREQLIINKALGMALSEQSHVTEDELQELYLKTYPRTTQFEVSHILLLMDEGAPPEREASVREAVDKILSGIKSGDSFEAMALKYSQDTSSAENGGRLGTFKEGELLPELEEVAATLKPGETGGPVRTSSGYHILKLLSMKQSEPPSFAEVRDTLEKKLLVEKEEPARTRLLNELKKTTYIEVFPDEG
jgi:parvulin-like peptidyl-prolyl isomerase